MSFLGGSPAVRGRIERVPRQRSKLSKKRSRPVEDDQDPDLEDSESGGSPSPSDGPVNKRLQLDDVIERAPLAVLVQNESALQQQHSEQQQKPKDIGVQQPEEASRPQPEQAAGMLIAPCALQPASPFKPNPAHVPPTTPQSPAKSNASFKGGAPHAWQQ